MYGLFLSFRMSSLRNWRPMPARRVRRLTSHPKCVSNLAVLAVAKPCTEQMRGRTTMYPSQVLNYVQVPRPPQPTLRKPISRLSRLLLAKMTPPPTKRVRGVMTPCRPPMLCPLHPLVLRKSNLRRLAADSLRGLVQLSVGKASNVNVVLEIYVRAPAVSN